MTRTTCATALLMLACINSGHAAETEDELAACRAIEADAERVACYDAIAHGQVEEDDLAVVPAAAAIEVAPSPAVTASADEDFGKLPTNDDLTRDSEEPESEDADQITATVTSVREYKRDRFVVNLDNGQEWRQTSASTLRLDVGDKIVIRKAALGSFKMAKVGSSHSMKVRRND